MQSRSKVPGNGKVDTELQSLITDLNAIQKRVAAFIGSGSARTYRNMSGEVGQSVVANIASFSANLSELQQIGARALVRSYRQRTAVGGSPTRRRRADGKIVDSKATATNARRSTPVT